MSALILNGKELAEKIYSDLRGQAARLKDAGTIPGLATVLVGDDPASAVYVQSKIKACEKVGIKSFHYRMPGGTTEKDLVSHIKELNANNEIHGILVQLPLPEHINFENVLMTISPGKDVDGLHPTNQGILLRCKSWQDIHSARIPISCTPNGVIKILEHNNVHVAGKHAVIVGRSVLVGKPLGILLLASNATVTICHSRTSDLPGICRQADILIAAIGKARFIDSGMVKEGAVVIDVGMNRVEKKLYGDVDFESVKERAWGITPVPGGVGPMTVCMLMSNTISAADRAKGKR